MTPGLNRISQLFSGANKFIIPKYQRAYAWEEQQLKDFWEDVYYHSSEQKYFFGTILLKEGEREGYFDTLEVVDGQQRLATITIFVSKIIEKLETINPEKDLAIQKDSFVKYRGVYKLKISDSDNTFFQSYILTNNSPQSFDTPSQRKLFDAKKYFENKLSEIDETDLEAELERMLTMIENADVLVYSMKNSAEAALIFQTANDRGIALTQLEKIKSYLMHRIYLSDKDASDEIIDNINSRFGEIFRSIERIQPLFNNRNIKEVGEDQICQYHYISHYDWRNKREYQYYFQSIKQILDTYGREDKHKDVVEYINDYTQSLIETFSIFEKILRFQNENLENIIYMRQVAVFFPLLVKAYKFDNSSNKENFSELLLNIEKFCFRFYFFNTKWRSDVRHIFNQLTRSFDGDFQWLFSQIASNIDLYCGTLIEALKSPTIGEYNKNELKYLFWKYENHLRENFQPKWPKMSFEEFNTQSTKSKFEIEHIHSQKPLNRLKFSRKTVKFKENYLNSLGNLTIAPKSSNASMGNQEFEVKKKLYFEKAPFKTQIELSDFVNKNKLKWDEQAITTRAKKIIEFALDKWGTAKDRI